MEHEIYGYCRKVDGKKVCNLTIDGKEVEVEVMPSGEERIISDPGSVDRDTLNFAVKKAIRESLEEGGGYEDF
jgi:hypothetical protein